MRTFYFTKMAVAILCILCTAGKLHAQFEEGKPDITRSSKIPCTAANAYSAPAEIMILPTQGESAKNIQNIIRFQFDELAHTSLTPGAPLLYFKAGFTAKATVSVEAWRQNPTSGTPPPDATFSLTLEVSYDPAAGAKYNPVAYRLLDNTTTGYEKVKATLSPVQVQVSNPANGWTANDVLPLLSLENEIKVLRYFSNPLLPAPSFNPVTYDVANHPDQLPVSWAFPLQANTSQLEYAWVENETKNYYNAGGAFNTDRLFRENSTRVDIDTSNQVFNIPLLFDANIAQGGGSLYYRVRSAYRKNDGTVITGDWSAPQVLSYNGHEPNLNWQSTTSFAENGKSKTVIQYFDGSLRPRQTVTKDNSTGNTTVAETIYDLQGRPSIQILPTPAIQMLPTPVMSTAIQYYKDFNRFVGQSTNDDPARYFDLAVAGNRCSGAPQLSTSYGNGIYYSPNNPLKNTESEAKFIPDANGYAFTQTRYTDDPTQRVSSQGGVGAAHQLGGTHTTDYYYGKPGQDELDALFGTEAGDASHYFKNMVKDANGQMSVSYVDMHGRTVATALAGDSMTGISAIYTNKAFYPSSASDTLTNYLITPSTNVVKGNTIENISTLLVPATTAYAFTYSLVPDILKQMDCNQQPVCFDCKYDLEISIRKEGCNTAPIIRRYNNLQLVAADKACSTPMGFTGTDMPGPVTQIGFSETLGIGSWVVRKTLSINDSLFAIRHDSALHAFLCKTQQTITDSVFAAMQTTSSCALPPASRNCDACRAALGNSYADNNYRYKQNFIAASGGGTTLTDAQIHALYTQDSLECATACGLSVNPAFSTLGNIRSQMLGDMMPYAGQYAIPEDSIKNSNGSKDLNRLEAKYNILASSFTGAGIWGAATGTKPYFRYPFGYYDAGDGSPDITIYPNGLSTDQSVIATLSPDNYTAMFDRNWANQLLPYHPEYQKLVYAQTTMADSYAWLDKFMQCNTYAAAAGGGYTTPLTSDPYFTHNYVPDDKKHMAHYLDTSVNLSVTNQYSIWQIANSKGLCDTTRPQSERQACLLSRTLTGIDPAATTAGQKDAIWQAFKSSYLGFRNDMVINYINLYAGSSLTSPAMSELQNEHKQLRFANSNAMAAQSGYGGSYWYEATGFYPDSAQIASDAQVYLLNNTTDKCIAQRPLWQSRLQQCEVLQSYLARETHNDSVTVTNILNLILDSMVMVCHNSIDGNNPVGASNVNPALMPKTPANFEDIINHVFTQNGIAATPGNNYFCNPYSVDYPKPYGSNPPVFEVKKGSVDSCNCAQFAAIKISAKAAGYDTTSLSSMNPYLLANYGDTLTPPLWQGLLQCNNHKWTSDCNMVLDSYVYLDSFGYHQYGPYPAPAITSFTLTKSTSASQPDKLVIKYKLDPHADSSWMIYGNSGPQPRVFGEDIVVYIDPCDDFQAYFLSQYPPTQDTNRTYWLSSQNLEISKHCSPIPNCDKHALNLIPLTTVSPIPSFLNCGYVKPCITCDQLQAYTTAFRGLYPACAGVPYTSNVDTAQAKQNALWARYLNYKTGFSKTANEYIVALQSCGTTTTTSVPATLVITSRSTQPPAGATQPQSYTAGSLITFDDGYVSAPDDYFQTIFDSTGSSNGGGGGTGNITYALCAFDKPVTYVALPDTAKAQQGSCAAVQQGADFIGQLLFSQVKDSLIASFDSLYRAKCLAAQSTEMFSVKYQPKEYHYTLYYYDGAGNLVKTIPPSAAKPNYSTTYLDSVKAARTSGSDKANYLNNELMATQYRYNTLNAVITQKSPDGGTSNTWYDRLGRLAVSQNAKQKAANNYSYTLYDALGRMTEVGQKPQTQVMTQAISQSETALTNWLSGGGLKEQITKTVYDVQYANGNVITPYLTQLNLRNRVSYVQAIDVENSSGTYRMASYYSYDVHGNADTVLHDYGSGSVMDVANNRFKLIKYDYDLISGKVNMVSYQPDKADGYYQQYRYDAENRLTSVLTSRDSILWQQDATYHYYRHGPLARTELGDLKVQGVDYAYTLQGWLKSINSSYNNISGDLYDGDGTGTAAALFARDAYKLNLNYYDDGVYSDYNPIASPAGYVQGNTLPSSARKNLYNGNISSIATNIRALNQPLLYNYGYDQLNRLVSMDAWQSNGLFAATGTAALPNYAERYTYDPNGNILTNKRWGKNRQLDDALYHYVADKNQLTYISDIAGNPTGSDIEGGQGTTNYGFDPIGEMTSDTKRGLTNATWTVYGKIATQQVSNGNTNGTITYTYDAMQSRISKTVTGAGGYTEWYVRDAQGNVLSIYRANDNSLNSGHLTQTEMDVYGSSRIGELNTTLDVSSNLMAPLQTVFTRGSKTFELTEQRGNVLITLSDKKLQVSIDNYQTVAYYNPDVITAQDYSSFGVIQDGRQYGTTPRFTYNGKQLDRELNWQDYGMRESDAITGRFVSVDPLTDEYTDLTPYQYASNSPIQSIDLDGAESLHYIDGSIKRQNELRIKVNTNIDLMGRYPLATIRATPPAVLKRERQHEYWTHFHVADALFRPGYIPKYLTYNLFNDAKIVGSAFVNGGRNATDLAGHSTTEKQRVGAFVNVATTTMGAGEIGEVFSGVENTLTKSFSSGGTKLMSSVQISEAETFGSGTFGKPAGTFISPTTEVDAMLSQGLNRSQIADKLGITDPSFFKGDLIRIDVHANALNNLNLRAPIGTEAGANNLFVPGGKTVGGVTEGIVDGIPKTGTGVSTTTVPKK